MNHPKTEVLIIGAGFSGLAAAKKLYENHTSFLLLEARDRLGGRVYTKRFEDFYLDFGGQWIGPTQDRMYELCRENGVEFFETYNSGKNIIDLRQRIKTYRGVIPKLNLFALLNLDWMMRKMQRMANSISLHAPWTHAKAKAWDKMTLEEFLRNNTRSNDAYTVIRVGCETIFACDPKDLSLLHALFYIRSGTSLDCLINIKNGAQQHRIKGGMQHLAEKMAERFAEQIHFNSPVKNIQKTETGNRVSGEGFEWDCKQIILAVPPPLLSEIDFLPELSPEKTQLLKNYPMGRVGKCFMIYDKPFWREMGFSGQSVADESVPFQTLFDCSPADGSKGILMGFTIGSRADSFFTQTKEERKQQMEAVLVRYFGDKARNHSQYEDFTMTDETWSRGCYAALMQPGNWTAWQDAYRKSEGNIHFAGTEAAERWHGYIEGAVLAGELAAEKCLASKEKTESEIML
ncbi:MAG: FAD-dependent oxidoreductase [Cytophagales bacterium]|uniref:Flavin monoamine oxidase family protein n=1 Tax=Algoriphagus taiwanensis TaxID=1445656 RepID=A0ABQ6Q3U8_9BACT|nr:MAG: FAD-dependent oxidoreductase [Cytophagales bacterium]GMQ34542.1 flavin monoamine oxidase family protein [Algoriphagus taiwanensis]